MTANRRFLGVTVLVLIQALAGCDRSPSSPVVPSPLTPSPLTPSPLVLPLAPANLQELVVFTDRSSGFSTSDARDADEQIVQFNGARELIWTASGARFTGYAANAGNNYITAGNICENCTFEVRFGTANGERRAYLTMNYHHDNPGTVVDLDVIDGKLVVTKTNRGAPGTFTLSGLAFEATAQGRSPVAGISLHIAPLDVYAASDTNGFYSIPGLNSGVISLWAGKDGYEGRSRDVKIDGNTRFDIQMVRGSNGP
jgi:hypothetical protein